MTDTSIAEVAERTLQKSEQAYLLVNFSGSNFQKLHPQWQYCHLIAVIKNQTQHLELDCLDNKVAFEEWIQNKLDFRHLLKRESGRFEKTNHVEQGQPVYKEIVTDYYWYLDNFHENHFEVFDNRGNHLGEADLEGNLNPDKQDKSKKFEC